MDRVEAADGRGQIEGMDQGGKQALLLGREHYRRGDYDRAELFLRQVVRRDGQYADVFDMLGVIAFQRGEYDRAEACFRRALLLNGSYTDARLHLAVTYNELGRYDDALKLCSTLGGSPHAPESPGRPLESFERAQLANLHARTAQAYQDAGWYNEAIAELEKALQLSPGFVDLRVRLGQLWRAAGQPERAEQAYRDAIASHPSYADAYLRLAASLLARERRAEALDVLGRLLEVDPNNPRARVYERRARESSPSGNAANS